MNKTCLQGDQCGYLHADKKDDLAKDFVWRPGSRGKKKLRPIRQQMFSTGVIGKLLITAAAMTGVQQAPTGADAMAVNPMIFREPSVLCGQAQHSVLEDSQHSQDSNEKGRGMIANLQIQSALKMQANANALHSEGHNIDFSFAEVETYVVPPESTMPSHGAGKLEGKQGSYYNPDQRERKTYTMTEMINRCFIV